MEEQGEKKGRWFLVLSFYRMDRVFGSQCELGIFESPRQGFRRPFLVRSVLGISLRESPWRDALLGELQTCVNFRCLGRQIFLRFVYICMEIQI